MVDLAKIRRKAKEKKEEAPSQPTAPSPIESSSAPASFLSETEVSRPIAPSSGIVIPEEPRSEGASVAPVPSVAASEKLQRFKETANLTLGSKVGEAMLASADDQIELLTFVLGREHYAVSIERIVEIIPPRSTTRVPNAESHVVGVISLRGTIVTVIDVRSRLGHSGSSPENDRRMIVVDNGGETAGFVVDRVLRVIKTSLAKIEAPPVVHSSEQSDFIRGVFHQGKVMSIFLDLEILMRSY